MNNQRDFWQKVLAHSQAGERGVLLCVVESAGSSPGRRGFKMFVTSSGAMFGSIGGGSMEHKLVELARLLLDQPDSFPFLKRQIHRPGLGQDRSGMICSGEQTVAYFQFGQAQLGLCTDVIAAIDACAQSQLVMSSNGIQVVSVDAPRVEPAEWSYREPLNTRPRIVIVGGGHVSLALSRTMNQLGFHVQVCDDRAGLNTVEGNGWAHERSLVDYANIHDLIPEDEELYVVLVSFGYRTDEIVLRQLIRKRFKYLGMLGSSEKIRTLFAAMRVDGFAEADLARVHAPIGLPINSRTPEEIAVSIAAEIIKVKNRA